jgi:hypothetical protein
MNNNYNNSKKFFNYIMDFNYKIIKDQFTNDIMIIKYDNKELKCKYLQIFTSYDDKIFWSDSNPYIDQKTQFVSYTIKKYLENSNQYNYNKINDNDIKKIINLIIKSDLKIKYYNEEINLLCVVTENTSEYKQFYLITELIYF